MAGGKGTRIRSVASEVPKPMIPILGKPILEYQVEVLRRNGLTDITIVTGHLGEAIRDYFGDGSRFGVKVTYYDETTPLGTAGALYKIYEGLGEDFLLLNGDVIFDMDLGRLASFHRERGGEATLVSHPSGHPADSSLLATDADDRITAWLAKEDPRLYYRNRVNAGIHLLSKRLLDAARPKLVSEKVDLDRDILKPLVREARIYAYDTPEYIKDMGTPERYRQVERDIGSGFVESRNLARRQRAVFLDRDGTLNRANGFVTRPEQFDLLPGAAAAVRAINESGYLAIVATNQPVIARGECSLGDLRAIHDKMETLLGIEGAYLDDLFFCPHHPDKGFPGEAMEYKIECECRKPKPGMLLAAAAKYNIDLSASYMLGDDERDMGAGRAAGCTPILVAPGELPKAVDRILAAGPR